MEYTEAMKLEITHDKLVDLLMHAATREDIATTKRELKDEIIGFRNELKDDIAEVKDELHATKNELKDNIAEIRNELHATKNELKEEITRLNHRMDKSDSKNDKILWFIILSILAPIFLHAFHL